MTSTHAWNDILDGSAFDAWLLSLGGGGQVPQGAPLDLFSTSLRVLKKVPSKLRAVSEGESVGGDQVQFEVDVVKLGLLERTTAGVQLSELGKRALELWSQFGVDDEMDDNELARNLILNHIAVSSGIPDYLEIQVFWRQVDQLLAPKLVKENSTTLYSVSYLNNTIDGYNPWKILVASEAEFAATSADWVELADRYHDRGKATEEAVKSVSRRVHDAASRGAGRLAFCRAMKLLDVDVNDARELLEFWEVSDSVVETCISFLDSATSTGNFGPETYATVELLEERHNVILYGPPGTGKTHHSFEVGSLWRDQNGGDSVFNVTFHPSYAYEDFIQGFRPNVDQPDTFKMQSGVFLRAIERARQLQPNTGDIQARKVLLLIDEINRGDVSRIFGELITYIEVDKRDESFYLSQSPDISVTVPGNLYLLGTMNTADKSISLLDIALRRRFAFKSFSPDYGFFENHKDRWLATIDSIDLGHLLAALNSRLLEEGVEADRSLGQALLLISAKAENPLLQFHKRLEYDVFPLVREYCYGDAAKVRRILGRTVDEAGYMRSFESLISDDFVGIVEAITSDTPTPTTE